LRARGAPIREAAGMTMSPRRVAVLAPMPSELRPVVKALGLRRADGAPFHTGRVGRVEVVAAHAGMGFALASAAASRVLEAGAVEHVVVVGIAGGIGRSRVGDVLVPATVTDRATGRSYVASPLVPGAGTISSSDEFLVDPERIGALVAAGVLAVDMETAAVAAVCEERGVAWSAVRVVSDLAADHPDGAVLGLAEADGTPRVVDAVRFTLRHPRRIPMLVRMARDSTRAANAAAREAARQLRTLA
jgi:adenosylhomocysteine nucleosidase